MAESGGSSGELWRKPKAPADGSGEKNVYRSAKDAGRKGVAQSPKKPPKPKKKSTRGKKVKKYFPAEENFTLEWYMKNKNPHYKDLVKWDKLREEKEKRLAIEKEKKENETRHLRIQKAKEEEKEELEI